MSAENPHLTIDSQDDRYSRLRLISWWDQELLRSAKIMVVGVGALGNEIIKNLALLGVGTVILVDSDYIELSNLSRSPLFRKEDVGKPKVEAAALAGNALNPDCLFVPLLADVTQEVGAGLFRRVDIVIAGLDNREARLAVNRACWRVKTPWVDGAIDDIRGVVRSFVPGDGPCYECTLGEQDNKLIAVRESCGFLANQAYRRDRTPTTPTMASIIAGIQVQEALKILHTLRARRDQVGTPTPALIGKGFFFDSSSYDCFTIEYVRRIDCVSHESYDNLVETELNRESSTPEDVFRMAAKYVGTNAKIPLPCELVKSVNCNACGYSGQVYRLVRSVSVEEVMCPRCDKQCVPEVDVECVTEAPYTKRTLKELGFAALEIVPVISERGNVQIEISGDAKEIFQDV